MQMSSLKEARKRIAKYQGCISAGGKHTVGLKTDGTVVAVGQNDANQCNIKGWRDVIAISASTPYTVGLKSDRVIVVGLNISGGWLGCDITPWSDIVSAYAGLLIFGLKSDGTVAVTAGYDSIHGWLAPAQNWRDVVAISPGMIHIACLKIDGTVFTVLVSQTDGTFVANNGPNLNTQSWQDIVAIGTGILHTVGLKADGTVVAVGDSSTGNKFGQCDIQGWQDIVAISAGDSHTVGLKSDGTVVAVGCNNLGQCNTQGWRDIVAISTGWGHTVGLKSDGTVVAVGNNELGQCNTQSWRDIGPADPRLMESRKEQERIEQERLRVETERKTEAKLAAEAGRQQKSKIMIAIWIGLGVLLFLVAIAMISGNDNGDTNKKAPVAIVEKTGPNFMKAIRTGLQASGKTRLVIETTQKPSYSLAYPKKQLQITLKNMQGGEAKPNIGPKTLVSKITSSQIDSSIVISVSLTRPINEIPEEQAVILEPGEDNKNFRIVLEFEAAKSR
jgi:hypothetical protein